MMYFYFSADYPAVIKLNNIYFGKIYDTVKTCKIDINDNTFIEIYPLNANEMMTCFILNKSFIENPPKNVSITDMHGGYLIKVTKSFFVGDFRVLAQEKLYNLNVTVFFENGIKVSIETPTDFFADNVELDADVCEIKPFTLNKRNFVAVIFLADTKYVLVYNVDNGIKKVFFKGVDDYSIFNDEFITISNYNDIAKHTVKSVWGCDNNGIKEKEKEITRSDNYDVKSLSDKIIPYAFLEEFLVGGNTLEFLSDNMIDNADKLNGYLGEFIGIMPPPVFRDVYEIGLVYKTSENFYDVKYASFELEDKKITNIKLN